MVQYCDFPFLAISLCTGVSNTIVQSRHVDIVTEPGGNQSSLCSCSLASSNVTGGRINVTLVNLQSVGRDDYCLALLQFDVYGIPGNVDFCAGNRNATGATIVTNHTGNVSLWLRQRLPYVTKLLVSVKGWHLLFASVLSS